MNAEAKIQLRLPVEIRDWLAKYSSTNSRSMNGQMIEILKEKKAQEEVPQHAPH